MRTKEMGLDNFGENKETDYNDQMENKVDENADTTMPSVRNKQEQEKGTPDKLR